MKHAMLLESRLYSKGILINTQCQHAVHFVSKIVRGITRMEVISLKTLMKVSFSVKE